MPALYQLVSRGGQQGNAMLLLFDFAGDADFHGG
jgi:hypothetical protein